MKMNLIVKVAMMTMIVMKKKMVPILMGVYMLSLIHRDHLGRKKKRSINIQRKFYED
jgi:hypothetical protein